MVRDAGSEGPASQVLCWHRGEAVVRGQDSRLHSYHASLWGERGCGRYKWVWSLLFGIVIVNRLGHYFRLSSVGVVTNTGCGHIWCAYFQSV